LLFDFRGQKRYIGVCFSSLVNFRSAIVVVPSTLEKVQSKPCLGSKRKSDMDVHKANGKSTFTGSFTAEIRAILRARRLEKGLTLNGAAKQFKVDYSTYRKWEVGPTLNASPVYFPRIKAFLLDDHTQGRLPDGADEVSDGRDHPSSRSSSGRSQHAPDKSPGSAPAAEAPSQAAPEPGPFNCQSACPLLASVLRALQQGFIKIVALPSAEHENGK